jgi:DNA-binding transcriptional regulator YhcF (GntR family)
MNEREDRIFTMVDRRDPTPARYQITWKIKQEIKAGRITCNAFVPSIRIMARLNKIDPSTVARAYKFLMRTGVLESEPRWGYRVREDYLKKVRLR